MPYGLLSNAYKLTLNGLIDGNATSNVFHYLRSSTLGTAAALTSSFVTNVLPSIQDIVSDAVLFTTIDCVLLTDPDDSAEQNVNLPGNRGSDFFAPNAAWGFKLFPSVASVQTGSKRFPGVSEVDVALGAATGLQALRMAITASKLQLVLSQLLVLYTPAIYSKVEPLGIPIERVATISSAVYNWLTTQNTRKYGRGA